MALGMGHEPQDAAGFITDAGDVLDGAVGIFRILRRTAGDGAIAKNNLPVVLQPSQNILIWHNKFPLGMGDRELNNFSQPLGPHRPALRF